MKAMIRNRARASYLIGSLLLAAILLALLATFRAVAQPGLDPEEVTLGVQKDVSKSRAAAGEVLTYSIAIPSGGVGDPVYAWLTDTVPEEVTLVPGSLTANFGEYGVAGNVITWTAEMHGSGYTAQITFSVEVSADLTSGTIINAAQVTGTGTLLEDTAETQIVVDSGETYLPLIFRNYPPIPVLNPINNGGGALSNYTVSWSAVDGPIDAYVLQESTRADFATISGQWSLGTTSRAFDKGDTYGTYYYRVRADNASSWGQGPWSNIQSVTIWGYYDDFSDSSSGWPVTYHPDPQDWYHWYYENGRYKLDVGDDRTDVKASPGVDLPPGDYVLEVDARFRYNGGWWTSYGIIFDGKDDPDPSHSDLGDYFMLWILWEGAKKHKWGILEDYQGGQADPSWQILDSSDYNYGDYGLEWNHWKIVRSASNIKVYVNGNYLGTVAKARPTTNYQVLFGLYGSTYETNQVNISWDDYWVRYAGTAASTWDVTPREPIVVSGDFGLERSLPGR